MSTLGNSQLLKVFCVVAMAFFIALLAHLTPLAHNPFQQRQITAEMLTWDNAKKSGWVTVDGKFVLLQRTGDLVGQPPQMGCQVEASGRYEFNQNREQPVFVATLIVIEGCPSVGVPSRLSN